MARSQETFNKKEREKKRQKKKQEKLLKREERKDITKSSGLDDMMAYVDEFGNIVDSPPDPSGKKAVKAENIELGVPKREKSDAEDDGYRGKVSHYNESKGYGFIKDLVTQENYFFHVNGVLEEVTEGDLVEFELERGQRGMNAVQVKKTRVEE